MRTAFLIFILHWVRPVWGSSALDDFSSPERHFRPKFRYWLPDASVSATQVVEDIEEIQKVGAGGLEFLAYYNYGQYIRNDVVAKILPGNWSKDGFASDDFNRLFVAGLKAAVDNGLVFDVPLGGSQGQGVPAEYQSTGLLKELIRGTIRIESGTSYSGPLPPPDPTTDDFNSYTLNFGSSWGSPDFELKSVVAAQLASGEQCLGSGNIQCTLAGNSLTDLTSQVAENGTIEWSPPSKTNGSAWILYAFYERYTDMRNVLVPEGATTWMGNGSWVVDHFSATGAKKATDFFDTHVFNNDEVKSLLPDALGLTWEDSMEFPSVLYWTPDLPNKFQDSRKYDLTPYLPIIHGGDTSWGVPYNVTYVLDSSSSRPTDSVVSDFLTVLSEGYYDYLDHLDKWSKIYGLKHSCQPAYNLPLNMAGSVPHVAVPELESLAFGNSPLLYKQFTGAAHISGQNEISTEVGAVNEGTYELSVYRLKNLFQGFFAVGVNMMMIHGFPYGGDYYDATWPGFTTFHYQYTEMYGPRQPQWRHFNDTILFTARNQRILQAGTPKVDLVFLYHNDRWSGSSMIDDANYLKAGFSYEFIDPDNLASPNVSAGSGLLNPNGPAYKALVLYNQTQITAEASAKLLELANEGLPIFVVGTVPNQAIGSLGTAQIKADMSKLTSGAFKSVKTVELESFSPDTLINSGIQPRVSLTSSDDAAEHTFSFWRSESDAEYIYIVNQGSDGGPYSTFTFTFENAANTTPYILDAWTGTESPLLVYNRTDDGGLTTTMRLKSQVSVIFALRHGRDSEPTVSSTSENIVELYREDSGKLVALINGSDGASVTLEGGEQKTLPSGPTLLPLNLTEWDLSIESYEPVDTPGNFSKTAATKIRDIPIGKLENLTPWTNITGLQNISGVGTYVTEFQWSYNSDNVAAHISFGPILNTLRAWVNGKLVDAVDVADASADISDLIHPGTNSLRIETSSTLFNAVKARQQGIHCLGESPGSVSAYQGDWRPFGLIGPVTIEPLRRVVIS